MKPMKLKLIIKEALKKSEQQKIVYGLAEEFFDDEKEKQRFIKNVLEKLKNEPLSPEATYAYIDGLVQNENFKLRPEYNF